MERTRTFSIAILVCIAAACLIPANASAEFTLSPQTKGWAVVDITSDSFTIEVKNTAVRSTCQIQVSPVTYQYVDNVTTFHPIPPELWQYITVTPEQVNLAAGESAIFTVQLAFPNLKEIYNHTWEYRILFNDTNKYTFEEQGPSVTQKTAIIRLYMPAGPYVKPYEAPFYLYPFMIIFSLIFLGGIIIYLKKRSVPLALRDHETRGSEWAGMEVGDHPNEVPQFRNPPKIVDDRKLPADIKAFIEDPLKSPDPQIPERKQIIRNPVPLKSHHINGERTVVRTPQRKRAEL